MKCITWTGLHTYEARYDERPTGETVRIESASTGAIEGIRRLIIYNVYVRDICVHCGAVVDRAGPTP